MSDRSKPKISNSFPDENSITSSFDEFDENSPDIILRNLINFELVDSITNEYVSVLDIGKEGRSICVIGDVVEPVSLPYKQRVVDYCCTVHQQNNSSINENQLAEFVAKSDTNFDRQELKVIICSSDF